MKGSRLDKGYKETPRTDVPVSQEPESAYELLTAYRFAQQLVENKSVLDIRWRGIGPGTRLLAESAESVAGLTGSGEALKLATEPYAAPNVEYKEARLPTLPYPEDHFDVAVAFGVIEKLEDPEGAVAEIKRALKPDGLLVLSTPDRRTHSVDRGHRDPDNKSEMHVRGLREMLGRRFGNVRIYRLGAVAGGMIFEDPGETSLTVESTKFSSTVSTFSKELPTTLHVLAVCSDAELPEDGGPYLLLDRDRRIFEEYGDHQEDVELLREEIGRMQATEVQAFQDALKFRGSEISYLSAQLERFQESEQTLQALRQQNEDLKQRLRGIENSNIWRLTEPYRRIRARLNGGKF